MEQIKLNHIFDSNLNFLLGSGASFGLFPTLALAIKDAAGTSQTVETLATHFSEIGDENRLTLLFMHYYVECIRPVQVFKVSEIATTDAIKLAVAKNYRVFLAKLLRTVQQRKPLDKRCNLFTTNYDGCIPAVADQILQSGAIDFVINDGTRGFSRRLLQARNFSSYLCQTGVFDRHQSSVPQLNLIHLHGSVYWQKMVGGIEVDYTVPQDALINFHPATVAKIKAFSAVLKDPAKRIADLPAIALTPAARQAFWSKYNSLPIVNPTKWKFHETVFEEHYYQMLRLLSYELEKPQSILVTFGFSFADEHILNLVRRSLSNPTLQVFICCFNQSEHERLAKEFESFPNVRCIAPEAGTVMDFTRFNDEALILEAGAAAVAALGVAA